MQDRGTGEISSHYLEWRTFYFIFIFNPHLRICFLIDFRERERERGERQRKKETSMQERNIDWLPPISALTQDPTCNLFGAWEDPPTN